VWDPIGHAIAGWDGKGRYVETSLLQTGLYIMGADISTALVTGEPIPRHDRIQPANPLWNSYPVSGGRWIMLVMIDPNRYWPKFCAAVELPELIDDERFADPFARTANSRELVAILDEVFAQKTLEQWKDILDAAGLIWSPVATVQEAIEDPQVQAMGYFQPMEHAEAGAFETVGMPFRIEGEDLGACTAAPPVDRDGRAILREAGIAEDEIDKLLS
jgi:crotonobetainyl-CoA:carnitine CoA-transferase CaiB-like acyl-CoA transferase